MTHIWEYEYARYIGIFIVLCPEHARYIQKYDDARYRVMRTYIQYYALRTLDV